MKYHVTFFFDFNEIIMTRKETFDKITKKLAELKIFLEDEISDPIAIMCTYGGKKWLRYAKIHLKNIQEDGIPLLQGLWPFIIRLSNNKMH